MGYNRWRIFERDGFRCVYCGAQPPDVKLHVDHRHPRSQGGSDHHLNLVTACEGCNLSKRARVPRWERCSPLWPEETDALEPGYDQQVHNMERLLEEGRTDIGTGDFVDAYEFWGPDGVGRESCIGDGWDSSQEQEAAE